MKAGERLAASLLIRVGVDLQGRADPGVSQDYLGIPGGRAEILEQRADCMPEVMHLDDANAVVFADASERSTEVAWLHRPRQDPIASMRLDRCEEDLATDTLQLLTDADLPSVEVDVIPTQPEDFAEAQAVEHEQQKRGVELIRFRDNEESASFLSCPWPDSDAPPFGQFDQASSVAND